MDGLSMLDVLKAWIWTQFRSSESMAVESSMVPERLPRRARASAIRLSVVAM